MLNDLYKQMTLIKRVVLKATKQMQQIAAMSDADPEKYHDEADNLLIDTMKQLGLDDLAEAYDNVTKWFA
jgi:hypothetical protein